MKNERQKQMTKPDESSETEGDSAKEESWVSSKLKPIQVLTNNPQCGFRIFSSFSYAQSQLQRFSFSRHQLKERRLSALFSRRATRSERAYR